MGRMKTFGKLLTKFNLEKPGKWHFSTNHATIKTWKLTKNDLEKPGVGPFWESGDPAVLLKQFPKGEVDKMLPRK